MCCISKKDVVSWICLGKAWWTVHIKSTLNFDKGRFLKNTLSLNSGQAALKCWKYSSILCLSIRPVSIGLYLSRHDLGLLPAQRPNSMTACLLHFSLVHPPCGSPPFNHNRLPWNPQVRHDYVFPSRNWTGELGHDLSHTSPSTLCLMCGNSQIQELITTYCTTRGVHVN